MTQRAYRQTLDEGKTFRYVLNDVQGLHAGFLAVQAVVEK